MPATLNIEYKTLAVLIYMHSYLYNLNFADQNNTHHTIKYSTTCKKKSQCKPHQSPPETDTSNLAKKIFLKNELS